MSLLHSVQHWSLYPKNMGKEEVKVSLSTDVVTAYKGNPKEILKKKKKKERKERSKTY